MDKIDKMIIAFVIIEVVGILFSLGGFGIHIPVIKWAITIAWFAAMGILLYHFSKFLKSI